MSIMVYDCFLFFNELDLLEIRLNVLSRTVDKFILVEASKTFTNKEKPFYFEENKKKFSQFLDKIIHIKINEYPATKDAWDMEDFQRNQIARGFSNCSTEDVILISDLDEIPNPEIIEIYKKNNTGIYRLKQLHFDYYINYQRCGKNNYWYNAKIARHENIIANNYTPNNVRGLKNIKTQKKGGWHFSFLGGMDNIVLKIQSISHQEWNNEKYLNDKIEHKIRMGLDLFDRKNIRLIPIKISRKKHPQYIFDNQEKYSQFICPHINYFIAIKNRIYCMPYYIIRTIKYFLILILPKNIIAKLRSHFGENLGAK